MNFLRRGATTGQRTDDEELDDRELDDGELEDGEPDAEELDDEVEEAPAVSPRRGVAAKASSPAPQTERKQKTAQRSSRMDMVRQARKASSAMQPPEPVRGLMVAAFLVAVGLVSFFGNDVANVNKKEHGKTVVVSQAIAPHPAEAVLLIVVALACAGSTYWRKRYVTGIAFMIAAAIGIGAPLPKSLSDLTWLTFLVPAGYVLWLLMFRMNKEQKAWLAAHAPANQSGGARSSSGAAGSKPQRGQAGGARGRSGKKREAAVTATGRPLPENSGRYTRPQAKPHAKRAQSNQAQSKAQPKQKAGQQRS